MSVWFDGQPVGAPPIDDVDYFEAHPLDGYRRLAEYHLYITNLPPDKLSAEDIQATHALRWEVEVLFLEGC